jgi:hypothetical protein
LPWPGRLSGLIEIHITGNLGHDGSPWPGMAKPIRLPHARHSAGNGAGA